MLTYSHSINVAALVGSQALRTLVSRRAHKRNDKFVSGRRRDATLRILLQTTPAGLPSVPACRCRRVARLANSERSIPLQIREAAVTCGSQNCRYSPSPAICSRSHSLSSASSRSATILNRDWYRTLRLLARSLRRSSIGFGRRSEIVCEEGRGFGSVTRFASTGR
jgi:hypothetical protein